MKWPYPPAVTGLLVLVAVYTLAGWGLALALGQGDRFSLLLYSDPVARVTFLLLTLFLGWRVYSLILFQRPRHLTRALIADVRARLLTREKILAALPVMIAFAVFMSAFSSLKGMIPLVQPYVFDQAFADLDRAIHGGVDPWRLLQPVLGYPGVTAGLNIIYNMWFFVMFAALYWQLFDTRQPQARMRFFWSYFLCFIINGTFLAMAMSSAGPCYYHHLVEGISPFAGQMAYLREAAENFPVWAVATQDQLWDDYQNSRTGFGSGISAMPSVHVSIAVLLVLSGWRHGRMARVFFTAFAACIMAGSVHLGWHYAVDGYFSILSTLAIWCGVGVFIREKS
jgi:hypothetical protein